MSQPDQAAVERSPATASSWRVKVVRVLSLAGAAVSGYLTLVHYSGGLALCTGAGGCEQVQASRYSTVGGVPVALIGLLVYLGLAGLSACRLQPSARAADYVLLALFGLALAGTLYSAYLTYLELFVIGAICPWCLSSGILMTAILILSSWELARSGGF